jgi:type IV fimbrial biogenesis protein FimT
VKLYSRPTPLRCHSATGISLIELLIALAIMAFLLTNVGLPGFRDTANRHDIDAAVRDLIDAISMARSAAISENVMVTLCRSSDGKLCKGSWENGSILFTDANADRVINGNDRLLFRFPALKPQGTLTFNSFRNQQYLQLTPRGATNNQNGNFTFCPANGDPRLIRQLIINITGRARVAPDTNKDGIVENSEGKPVECKATGK